MVRRSVAEPTPEGEHLSELLAPGLDGTLTSSFLDLGADLVDEREIEVHHFARRSLHRSCDAPPGSDLPLSSIRLRTVLRPLSGARCTVISTVGGEEGGELEGLDGSKPDRDRR